MYGCVPPIIVNLVLDPALTVTAAGEIASAVTGGGVTGVTVTVKVAVTTVPTESIMV